MPTRRLDNGAQWPAVLGAAVLLALALAACGRPAGPIRAVVAYRPAEAAIRDDDALCRRHGIAPSSVGYLLEDLDTGRVLAQRQPDRGFIPASTLKVLTMTAALQILGPAHRFETGLWSTGRAADGVLQGDLYLKGGGDPLLTINGLAVLADRLAAAGIRRVAGRFFYDQSRLAAIGRIHPDQPAEAAYNPGVSALSLDFNRQRLTWLPTDDDRTVTAFFTPQPSGDGDSVVELAPPASGTQPTVSWDNGTWRLSPLAPVRGTERLPVKDPGRRTAAVFRAAARLSGVDLPRPAPAAVPAAAVCRARLASPPLHAIVRLALEHSNNLVAELVGQAAARRLGGAPASLAQGARRLADGLQNQLPAAEKSGMTTENHSGLSAAARISPRRMVAVLRLAETLDCGGRRFHTLLPAAGWGPTFGKRYRDPAAAMRLWAKTGTMNYASALAGMLLTESGRRVLFALFVTDLASRRAYDARPRPESPEVRQAAETWLAAARNLQRDLVGHWIVRVEWKPAGADS